MKSNLIRGRQPRKGPRQKLSWLLAALLLAGCSKEGQQSGPTTSASGPRVVLRGSNTIGEELGPRLIADYKKEHPQAVFDLEFKGTSYGIGNLMGGFCDIACASKAVVPAQQAIARERGVEFKDYVLGSYVVEIIVNAANPVSNLTSNQVLALFTGQAASWNQAGGPDRPVHLFIRDPISGTHIGFKELAMANREYDPGAKPLTNYAAIIEAVANDQNAVGYCGLDMAKRSDVKVVSIEGVAPSVALVNQQKYPYARRLLFYTDASKERPEARQFIDFALSARGQEILSQMGYATHP
jgi:phosphate transport system substrate-binding protein